MNDIKITVRNSTGEKIDPEENAIEFLKAMELLFDSHFLEAAFKSLNSSNRT